MNTTHTNEAQAQELLALIPASFQEAFRIKLVYLEGAAMWSLLIGECSASFAYLDKLEVQAEDGVVRIKSGATTLHLYAGSYKFYTLTIL